MWNFPPFFFFYQNTRWSPPSASVEPPGRPAAHTSDGFAPFSPPQSDHIKAPPPTFPHPGSLPRGATLLMDRIRHQNNKAVHKRRTMYWRWWRWVKKSAVTSLNPSGHCPTLESRGEPASPPTDVYCHTRQAGRPKQPPPPLIAD